MYRTLIDVAKGTLALLAISLNTIVLTLLLCLCSIAKWLAPTPALRGRVRAFLARIAEAWISCNNAILSLYRRTVWDLELPQGLRRDGCYLVSCNHRSWVDILVLQRCFNRRLPLLRFFIKRELIRVPFLGMAWWALDFPFMRRDSKATLERHPERRGRDLENARKACEKFREIPVAMMNFPEGTRFSLAKRDRFGSPYEHLLLPRIGGMGQVLYALGDQLDALIDVTIVYPGRPPGVGGPSLWDLLTGRIPRVLARASQLEIGEGMRGRDFRADPGFRRELESWMNGMWEGKDRLIGKLLDPAVATSPGSASNPPVPAPFKKT